jgi:hypothetical protein
LLSFHSLSERRRRSKIDIWPGAPIAAFSWVRIFLGLAGNGRAIELEADLGFRHDWTPFNRRIWGHGSGIPSLLWPIQNSG